MAHPSRPFLTAAAPLLAAIFTFLPTACGGANTSSVVNPGSPDASAESDAASDSGGETPEPEDSGEEDEDAGSGEADANEGERDAGGSEDFDSGGQEPPVNWKFCTEYDFAKETQKLEDSRLTGVSGIVASRQNAGILWVHNDYAGTPTVFAVDAQTGKTKAVLWAPAGVTAKNIEDIALARCPWTDDEETTSEAISEANPYGGAPCLWLADSGNNNQNRTDLSVIVLPEPKLSSDAASLAAPEEITAGRAWQMPYTYQVDNCDSEAFVVEPDGSAMFLIEKVNGDARIFEASGPFADGVALVFQPIGTLPAHQLPQELQNLLPLLPASFREHLELYGLMMTGADLHPSRKRLLLRTYIGSFEYRFTTGDWPREMPGMASDFDRLGPALGQTKESQGEAVAYDADGMSYWTISEDPDQKPGQGIHYYSCANGEN